MKQGTELTQHDRAIIIVGDPGTRKTTLALNFPYPYFLDCDGNMAAPVAQTGIREFLYDSAARDDNGNLIHPADRFQHCIKCLNAAVAEPRVKTIVIDSLTSFFKIVLSDVLRQEFGSMATTDLAKDAADFKTLRQQDWGKFAKLIDNIFSKLRGCGKTLVVIAHNNMDKDEADGKWKIFLNIPGSSKNTLSGMFTDCWNTFLQITGIGPAATYSFMIRTLPQTETDHRGVTTSFPLLPRIATYDQAVKEIKKLHTT